MHNAADKKQGSSVLDEALSVVEKTKDYTRKTPPDARGSEAPYRRFAQNDAPDMNVPTSRLARLNPYRVLIAASAIIAACCVLFGILKLIPAPNAYADTVVYGNIYTADAAQNFVECIAIKDGKYIYVGNKDDVQELIGPNTETVEAGFVMPGATESHGHFVLEAAFKQGLYISPTKEVANPDAREDDSTSTEPATISQAKTLDDIVADVETYVKEHPTATLIVGYGWDSGTNLTSGTLPTRQMLDEVCPDVPIMLYETSLHAAWCNTACLISAGVLDTDAPVTTVKRDYSGLATGIILDEACAYVYSQVFGQLTSDENYQTAVQQAEKTLNSMGYTAHYDAWSNFDGTDAMYRAISSVDASGKTTALLASAYCINTFDNYDEALTKAQELQKQYSSQHYYPTMVKLFADGVTEAQTGYVKSPYYSGDYGNNYGTRIWEPSAMNDIVSRANAAGLTVQIHTFGDAAVSEAVDAFALSNTTNNATFRNILAHVAMVDENDYARIALSGVAVATAANWGLTYDSPTQADLQYLYGNYNVRNTYPSKKFLDYGIKAAVSTDHPCALGYSEDVFDYMGVLVTGVDYTQTEHYAATKTDFCDVYQAIEMLTINGAWTLGLEETRGTIEVGKYADFIVASASPFETAKENIHTINVVATYFEGKRVYARTEQ